MYSAHAEHSKKIAIKSAKALVPGYGASGVPFGGSCPPATSSPAFVRGEPRGAAGATLSVRSPPRTCPGPG